MAFGPIEASAGSEIAASATEYKKRDGLCVLAGTKVFKTNGGEADFAAVLASSGRARGYRGISASVVDERRPRFSVGRREEEDGHTPSFVA